MKTTVELPDEVMISLKVKAAKEGKKLKTLIEEALRQFLFPEMGNGEKPESKAKEEWAFPVLPPHEMDDKAALLRQETEVVGKRAR